MEENKAKASSRVPWWMTLIIIVAMLPGLGFPWLTDLFALGNQTLKALTWFYPAYVLCSGYLAYQCFGRRSYLTWIILALLMLSHLCFYILAFSSAANALRAI